MNDAKKTFVLVLAGALALGPVAQAQELVRIGAAAAVTGRVTAVDPLEQKKGAPAGRILASGKTVYHLDKIVSDGQGRLQVMLLDQTVFTLGPNTEMTLDEFVYDPFTDTGKITANVTKGVFRFVTGKVARKDPENMKIKMPVGSIGIRGTIGGGYTDGKLGVAAFYGPGPGNDTGDKPAGLTFAGTGSDATTLLNRPNTASMIDKPGGDPSPPFDISKLGAKIAGAQGGGGDKKKGDKSDKKDSSPLDTTPPPPSDDDSGGDGTSGGTPEGGTVTDDAGGTVGDTLGSLENTGDIGTITQIADATVNTQAQDAGGILDGIAKWDQLNNNLSGGTGHFRGAGVYSCSGGEMCASPTTGGIDYALGICFLTKTYGGGYVKLMTGPLAGLQAPSSETLISASQPFPTSGDAVITLNQLNSSEPAFFNTTLTIKNSGGVQATGLDLNLQFDDGMGDAVAGSGVAIFNTGSPPSPPTGPT